MYNFICSLVKAVVLIRRQLSTSKRLKHLQQFYKDWYPSLNTSFMSELHNEQHRLQLRYWSVPQGWYFRKSSVNVLLELIP